MVQRKRSADRTDPASASQAGIPKKRGGRKPPLPSEHAKKVGAKNFEAGRKKRDDMRKQAQDEGLEPRSVRWARLLDGTMKVSDLTDEELKRMTLRSKDGSFAGKAPMLPSHIAQQMRAESLKRAQDKFHSAASDAVEELLKIGADPEAKESDRIRALTYIVDRALGKTPETVRVEGVDRFSDVVAGAVGLNRDIPDDARELDDEASDA